jgi:hypothetical protein
MQGHDVYANRALHGDGLVTDCASVTVLCHGMPSGPFLYADELMASIRKKFQKRGFKEMVM